MKKCARFSPPAVGASALLVSLSVLVLCVFALLSLSSAQAEHRLATTSAEAASAYYAADLQAEEIFCQLRNGEIPPQVTCEGDTYSYTCPISDHQFLRVTVANDTEGWKVITWQAVSLEPAEIQTAPTLWDGGDNL